VDAEGEQFSNALGGDFFNHCLLGREENEDNVKFGEIASGVQTLLVANKMQMVRMIGKIKTLISISIFCVSKGIVVRADNSSKGASPESK